MSTWRRRRAALAALTLGFIVAWPLAATYYYTRRLEAIAKDMSEYLNRSGGDVEISGPGEGNVIGLRGGKEAHRIHAVGGGPDLTVFALSADPRLCLATLLHTGPEGDLVLDTYQVGQTLPSPAPVAAIGELRLVRISDPTDDEVVCQWKGGGAKEEESEGSPSASGDRLARRSCLEESELLSRQVLGLAERMVKFEEHCEVPLSSDCKEELGRMKRELGTVQLAMAEHSSRCGSGEKAAPAGRRA